MSPFTGVNNKMINLKEYESMFPTVMGEMVNVHHCKQGQQNDRMYIRRNEDGSVVAYCHHCCEHGYVRPPRDIFGTSGSSVSGVDSTSGSNPSGSAEEDECFDRMDGLIKPERLIDGDDLKTYENPQVLSALCYITANNFQLACELGLGYLPESDKVYFPYYTNGVLSAFQTRYIDSFDKDYTKIGPKYLTTLSPIHSTTSAVYDPMYYSKQPMTRNTRVFLVEDWISAMCLSVCVPAIPLMGVNLNDTQLEYVVTLFDKVAVWLDNDNAVVRGAANNTYQRLSALGTDCHIVGGTLEPKDMARTGELGKYLHDCGYITDNGVSNDT